MMAILILACLVGHPDRCDRYTTISRGNDDCHDAAWRWADRRPWLVPIAAVCIEEEDA